MVEREPGSGTPHGPWVLYTVGHSTRPIEDFIALLARYGIRRLVDVRTIARSRHNPQYEAGALAQSLARAGIEYVPMPALGGLRHTRRDSPNGGFRNASFRGFADYMQTPEFDAAIDALMALARARPSAIMCAEAVPWRCHRSLVADALVVRGVAVDEVLSATSHRPHRLTPFAHVEGTRITYPEIGAGVAPETAPPRPTSPQAPPEPASRSVKAEPTEASAAKAGTTKAKAGTTKAKAKATKARAARGSSRREAASRAERHPAR